MSVDRFTVIGCTDSLRRGVFSEGPLKIHKHRPLFLPCNDDSTFPLSSSSFELEKETGTDRLDFQWNAITIAVIRRCCLIRGRLNRTLDHNLTLKVSRIEGTGTFGLYGTERKLTVADSNGFTANDTLTRANGGARERESPLLITPTARLIRRIRSRF